MDAQEQVKTFIASLAGRREAARRELDALMTDRRWAEQHRRKETARVLDETRAAIIGEARQAVARLREAIATTEKEVAVAEAASEDRIDFGRLPGMVALLAARLGTLGQAGAFSTGPTGLEQIQSFLREAQLAGDITRIAVLRVVATPVLLEALRGEGGEAAEARDILVGIEEAEQALEAAEVRKARQRLRLLKALEAELRLEVNRTEREVDPDASRSRLLGGDGAEAWEGLVFDQRRDPTGFRGGLYQAPRTGPVGGNQSR